jgi:hypothetical protein
MCATAHMLFRSRGATRDERLVRTWRSIPISKGVLDLAFPPMACEHPYVSFRQLRTSDGKRLGPECATSGCEQSHQKANYSITSSARASNEEGTVRPSALAVLRLIASSSFVTCCTGKSAGFSPSRMRLRLHHRLYG